MKRFLNPFCVTQVIQRVRQTRCVLVSLVMALLLSVNAFATETVRTTITIDGEEYYLYTGFNVIAYTDGNVPGHETSSLVDGNISASGVFQSTGSRYLEFSSDVPIILKGYIFDLLFEGRYYPTSWTLKAKQNEEDDWDIVSSKSGYKLTGMSSSVACDNSENKAYSYFYLEVESDRAMAITELRLYGGKDFTYAFRPKKSATCTAIGYKQDSYLRSDGKYFTDQTGTTELLEENVIIPIVPHTFLDESGETLEFCSICGGVNLDHNHGYCGDPEVNDGKDVTWRVTQEENGNYTLTISGTGRMADYGNEDNAPWRGRPKRNYLDKITKFVVEEGVTSVGVNACYKWGGLKDVKLPNSITEINPWAFGYCSSLESINIPYGVTTVGYSVFYDCTALTKVEIPCSLEYASYWNIDESVIVKYHAFENQPFIDGGDGTHYKNCKCGNTTSTPESHAFTVEDVTIDGANESAATCTEKAKYYKSCVCGALSTSEVFEVGEPLGHSWGEYHLDGDQTCTYDGHKTAECTREGCSEENKIVATGAALGHDWGEYTLDGDQTCEGDGHKTAKCTREGCSEENKIVATGAALGHAWGEYHLDGDQTCTNDGHKTAECTREGCSEKNKIVATGAAFGHDYSSETATEPYIKDTATCTADAVYFHKCSRCGDKGATTWAKASTALGHSWGEYHLDGDQTCTNDGHKTAECTREGCSEKNKIVATGAALGHAWEDFFTVDVREDCEHTGSKSIHCHRLGCEARKDETVIPALGHSFTEYFSNDDATTETDGTKTAECDRGCGATETVIDEGSRIIETPTGINDVKGYGHNHTKKYTENGQLVIEKDGVKYSVDGRVIK